MSELVLEHFGGIVDFLKHHEVDVIILRGEAQKAFLASLVGKFDPNPGAERGVLSAALKAKEIRAAKEGVVDAYGHAMGYAIGRRFSYILEGE